MGRRRVHTDNVVISFSGGRTSALMTIEMLKQEKYKDAIIIFANTGKENEATLLFVHQVDQYIQKEFDRSIVWIEYNPDAKISFNIVTYETASRKGEPFSALIKKRMFCPNRVARFCTQELKIRPMKKYCQRVIKWRHWTNMVGIRHDEPNRWVKSKDANMKEIFDVEHPLVTWKITKPDVLKYWRAMPFDLVLDELDGNCDICFLKGKKKKMMIARRNPERFDWWIEQEKLLQAKGIAGRFMADGTYEQLLAKMRKAPELFDNVPDDSIDCFCNVD